MRSGIRKTVDDFSQRIETSYRKYSCRKSARARLKKMGGGYECTKEYNEIVVPYWKRYGVKPQKMWYRIFWDRTHEPDPRYIPDDIFYGVIVPYFSNPLFRRFGEDKCQYSVWFKDLKKPDTIIKNIAGVYYNGENEIIDKKEAIRECLKHDEFIIKPSIDSGEGRLIRFFNKKDIIELEVDMYFEKLGANFIVQKTLKQHPVLSQLNESSVNTIRIVSFFFKGQVHILSSILRIGAKGSKVDNIGAGGYACAIEQDGHLVDMAVNRNAQWVSKTKEGVTFKGIVIPSYERIIDIVKQEHKKLAHFKIIGWDFSVDQVGDPVFIEYNVCAGTNQITFGPTFGDLTDEVLEEVFIKKTLKNSQN